MKHMLRKYGSLWETILVFKFVFVLHKILWNNEPMEEWKETWNMDANILGILTSLYIKNGLVVPLFNSCVNLTMLFKFSVTHFLYPWNGHNNGTSRIFDDTN